LESYVSAEPSATATARSFDKLSQFLGARVTLQPDYSTEIIIPATDHLLDETGRHGDLALMCAIDVATGMASSMSKETTTATLTSDLSVDMIAPPAPGPLRTTGRVVNVGKRIIMNQAIVTDSTSATVAFATAGYAPIGEAKFNGATHRPLGETQDLAAPEYAQTPIAEYYSTAPSLEVPDAISSIDLNEMTANPFGFLHGAVGAHLFLSGARRHGIVRPNTFTVRYLRPVAQGPADVLVEDLFENGDVVGMRLSLIDRGTGKIASIAHVAGRTS
ncbi:MAG: PaaI family thioesterase, partial [Cumulibacter sp.]